ncbi:MAG: hypothetical protein ACOCXZ_01215 [Chloroflexota bacterium]
MTVTLTTTWRPQGELARLRRFLPDLRAIYDHDVVIVLLPDEETDAVRLALRDMPGVVLIDGQYGQGRMSALEAAYQQTPAATIHYCDMDRLIRWVETKPDALRQTVRAIQGQDAVMIGRVEADFATHPASLVETETLVFDVAEFLLGQRLDLSSGSKGFSREAVAHLLRHRDLATGLGSDMAWPVLLHRAGFDVSAYWTEGLDWETADRFQPTAADPARQRELAAQWDADASRWAYRVQVAQNILRDGLAAMRLPIEQITR